MTADVASGLLFSQPRAGKRCKTKVRIIATGGAYYVCTTVNWQNKCVQKRVRGLLDILLNLGFRIIVERVN